MKKFLLFILVIATSFMCGFAAPSNPSDTTDGKKIIDGQVCKGSYYYKDGCKSEPKNYENGVRRAIGNKDDSSSSSNSKDNSKSSSGNGSSSSSNSSSGSSYGSSSGNSSGSNSSGSSSSPSNKPNSGTESPNKSEKCQSTTCGQDEVINGLPQKVQ